jgi:histidinol-phosphate aminotransferase
LAGLRIGYGIAAKEIIAELERARAPFNVNRLAQVAALAALDDRSFLLQSLDVNDDGKGYLYEHLKKLGLMFERTEANFIYVDVPRPAQDIFKKMMEHGVIIRPLDSFGRPNAIRITVGASWQNKRCIEALKKALGKHS